MNVWKWINFKHCVGEKRLNSEQILSRMHTKLNALIAKCTWWTNVRQFCQPSFSYSCVCTPFFFVTPFFRSAFSFQIHDLWYCVKLRLCVSFQLDTNYTLFGASITNTLSWLYQGCIVDRSLVKCLAKVTKHSQTHTHTFQALCQLNGCRSIAGGQPRDREAWSCTRVSAHVPLCSFVGFHVSVWAFICVSVRLIESRA